MITTCPRCRARYQVLRSDLYDGPLRARCEDCMSVFPLNDITEGGGIRPLTLPPGTLIPLGENEDISNLDAGPEWVGDDLMGPLVMLTTEPPPLVRMSAPQFGKLEAPLVPQTVMETEEEEEAPPRPLPVWQRALHWLGLRAS